MYAREHSVVQGSKIDDLLSTNVKVCDLSSIFVSPTELVMDDAVANQIDRNLSRIIRSRSSSYAGRVVVIF